MGIFLYFQYYTDASWLFRLCFSSTINPKNDNWELMYNVISNAWFKFSNSTYICLAGKIYVVRLTQQPVRYTPVTVSYVTHEDVNKTLLSLRTKTSTGIDGISVKLLKSLAPVLTNPLTLIINQSLTMGIFPSKLKMAKVLPLFKKNDPHIMDNYRPISLLTSISKLFEKVVFNQCLNIFTRIIYSMTANMVSANCILQNLLLWNSLRKF